MKTLTAYITFAGLDDKALVAAAEGPMPEQLDARYIRLVDDNILAFEIFLAEGSERERCEAIRKTLVRYGYHPTAIELADEEQEEWT